jgi:hypothetical protein
VSIRPRRVVVAAFSLLLAAAFAGALAQHPQAAQRPAQAATVGEPAPSIFSLNTGTFDSSHANFVRDIPTARRLGAHWVHFTGASIHWSARGQIDYRALDYEVNEARKRGLGVLVSLGGARGACSVAPRPENVTACPPIIARDMRAYRSFLRALVLRYRNSVEYWESWLEPNHRSFWPSGPNPAQYDSLLEAEYAVFQSVNRTHHLHLKLLFAGPSDFSIIPGSRGGIAVLPFVHRALEGLHGRRAFDAIALHPYRFPPLTTGPSVKDWDSVSGIPSAPGASGPYPGEGCLSSPWCQMSWPQELSAYEQEFIDNGYGQVPLWLTEFGWPGNARQSDGYHPSYQIQAQYLIEAYRDLLGLKFVQAAFWFNLRDYKPGYRSPDPEFFYHYGLLRYDFSRKPAGTAFQRLAQRNPRR